MFYPNQINGTEIIGNVFNGIENIFIVFNEFNAVFFVILKFIFVFILLSLGFLTLKKLRGVYINSRLRNEGKDDEIDALRGPRCFLGIFYLFVGFGILFNYLTYFLIFALDPIPDRFIFSFINFNGDIDPLYINRIEDISASLYPHEKTIYYGIAYLSFIGTLSLVLSVWYLINSNRLIQNPSKSLGILVEGIISSMFFGFTTFLPLFL